MKNSTAFILILVAIGLFYTFISPEYGKLKAHRAEATSYGETLSRITDLSKSRDTLLTKYDNLPADQIARLSEALPSSNDPISFVLDLESIASRHGITLKSVGNVGSTAEKNNAVVSDGTTPTGAAYGSTDLQISFVASYSDFRDFLEDLEKSLRIMDVRSAAFGVTDSGLSEYNLVVRAYWLK